MFWYDTALMLQWIMLGDDDDNDDDVIMRIATADWQLGVLGRANWKVVSDDRKAITGSVSLFYYQWSTLEILIWILMIKVFIWAKNNSPKLWFGHYTISFYKYGQQDVLEPWLHHRGWFINSHVRFRFVSSESMQLIRATYLDAGEGLTYSSYLSSR